VNQDEEQENKYSPSIFFGIRGKLMATNYKYPWMLPNPIFATANDSLQHFHSNAEAFCQILYLVNLPMRFS